MNFRKITSLSAIPCLILLAGWLLNLQDLDLLFRVLIVIFIITAVVFRVLELLDEGKTNHEWVIKVKVWVFSGALIVAALITILAVILLTWNG